MAQARYKIGQVAALTGLKTFVLRFWESEFPELKPIRTPTGQRLYTDAHLALIERIRALLYADGLTIEGARKKLKDKAAEKKTALLEEVERELKEIRAKLAERAPD